MIFSYGFYFAVRYVALSKTHIKNRYENNRNARNLCVVPPYVLTAVFCWSFTWHGVAAIKFLKLSTLILHQVVNPTHVCCWVKLVLYVVLGRSEWYCLYAYNSMCWNYSILIKCLKAFDLMIRKPSLNSRFGKAAWDTSTGYLLENTFELFVKHYNSCNAKVMTHSYNLTFYNDYVNSINVNKLFLIPSINMLLQYIHFYNGFKRSYLINTLIIRSLHTKLALTTQALTECYDIPFAEGIKILTAKTSNCFWMRKNYCYVMTQPISLSLWSSNYGFDSYKIFYNYAIQQRFNTLSLNVMGSFEHLWWFVITPINVLRHNKTVHCKSVSYLRDRQVKIKRRRTDEILARPRAKKIAALSAHRNRLKIWAGENVLHYTNFVNYYTKLTSNLDNFTTMDKFYIWTSMYYRGRNIYSSLIFTKCYHQVRLKTKHETQYLRLRGSTFKSYLMNFFLKQQLYIFRLLAPTKVFYDNVALYRLEPQMNTHVFYKQVLNFFVFYKNWQTKQLTATQLRFLNRKNLILSKLRVDTWFSNLKKKYASNTWCHLVDSFSLNHLVQKSDQHKVFPEITKNLIASGQLNYTSKDNRYSISQLRKKAWGTQFYRIKKRFGAVKAWNVMRSQARLPKQKVSEKKWQDYETNFIQARSYTKHLRDLSAIPSVVKSYNYVFNLFMMVHEKSQKVHVLKQWRVGLLKNFIWAWDLGTCTFINTLMQHALSIVIRRFFLHFTYLPVQLFYAYTTGVGVCIKWLVPTLIILNYVSPQYGLRLVTIFRLLFNRYFKYLVFALYL